MSEQFYDEMEQLIGKHRQQDADKARDEATEERFKRIETGLEGIGKLIDERLPANSSPQSTSEDLREDKGEGKPSPASDDKPSPEPEEDLPVERVTKFSVPKIYTGDDEPEIVRYIDADTGEEKTRKGRRKNRPCGYDVQIAEAEVVEDAPIPQEPDEANG